MALYSQITLGLTVEITLNGNYSQFHENRNEYGWKVKPFPHTVATLSQFPVDYRVVAKSNEDTVVEVQFEVVMNVYKDADLTRITDPAQYTVYPIHNATDPKCVQTVVTEMWVKKDNDNIIRTV